MTTMTPYAAAKIVNTKLADLGIAKKLPPQMLYTYVSKGYVKSTLVDGKPRVTEDQLAEWFAGYVAKLTNKAQSEPEAEVTSSVWNFGDIEAEQDTDTDTTEVDDEDTDEA